MLSWKWLVAILFLFIFLNVMNVSEVSMHLCTPTCPAEAVHTFAHRCTSSLSTASCPIKAKIKKQSIYLSVSWLFQTLTSDYKAQSSPFQPAVPCYYYHTFLPHGWWPFWPPDQEYKLSIPNWGPWETLPQPALAATQYRRKWSNVTDWRQRPSWGGTIICDHLIKHPQLLPTNQGPLEVSACSLCSLLEDVIITESSCKHRL